MPPLVATSLVAQVPTTMSDPSVKPLSLCCFSRPSGVERIRTDLHIAFDEAALAGRDEQVRRMLSSLGLEVCGGESRGLIALQVSAANGHLNVVEILSKAGVKDSDGKALVFAINFMKRDCVEFLLKQYDRESLDHAKSSGPEFLHVLTRNYLYFGPTFSPRLARWIMNAGANAESPYIHDDVLGTRANFGPLRKTLDFLMGRHGVNKVPPTLVAIDRLLKQEDAVHAISWLWVSSESSEGTKKRSKRSTSTHILRKSAHVTSRVVLGGLLRYTRKEF